MVRKGFSRGGTASLLLRLGLATFAAVSLVGGSSGALTTDRSSASRATSVATAGTTLGARTSPTDPVVVDGPTYTVSGNQITADGVPFVPYGTVVFGLSYPNWRSHVAGDKQQIIATATTWHANTVRIEVAPPDLFSQSPFDATYLSAIESEVAVAQTNGLNVILGPQYERTTHVPMPDSTTLAFWQLIAPLYADDPGVWFDLFNEPSLSVGAAGSYENLWSIWRNGGSGYIGMQELVDTIRQSTSNLIIAEGVEGGLTLSDLQNYALTGDGIAYGVHPFFEGLYWSTPQAWAQNWGDLASDYPIVADGWGEYETGNLTCQPDAPTLVPEFLSYLASEGIGLMAWTLEPGILVVGSSLSDPTTFTPGVPFVCKNDFGGKNGQGSGTDVLVDFIIHSQPIP